MGPANRQNFQGTRPAVPGAGSQSATSRMAAATAAVEETVDGSPTPFAPKGPHRARLPHHHLRGVQERIRNTLINRFYLILPLRNNPLVRDKNVDYVVKGGRGAGGRDPESA